MNPKILCVDDEPNILSAFERHLRKEFAVSTARDGAEALELVAKQGPFAVLISDMRMPGMSGVELLARVRQAAPDTVRIMLTGNAEQQTAVEAINEGHIFRFLTKPCAPELLARTVAAGVEQHRLITAEKELLEQTLRGTITMLTEVLELANPLAFGRSARVRRLGGKIAQRLQVVDPWQIEVAAMLSQVGCIAISGELVDKAARGLALTPQEASLFANHPRIGRDLIAKIPRLKQVAEIVACQDLRFDGVGAPEEGKRGNALPIEARILKLAIDFDSLRDRGETEAEAFQTLSQRRGWYDPAVLAVLRVVLDAGMGHEKKTVRVADLTCQMVLQEDVLTGSGARLVAKGQEITPPLLMRLRQFADKGGIREPITVLTPAVS
ncbi:MAG TPA: HD domain-containing phosphohydrolase [Gemmataceae bacterium]|nr:HD domain-containing phosphohydrolase [Gemmataceae bacterium]